MNRSPRHHAAGSPAPDNLIKNPLDKAKRDDRHVRERPRPRNPADSLITNPLDEAGALEDLIQNPLDKR